MSRMQYVRLFASAPYLSMGFGLGLVLGYLFLAGSKPEEVAERYGFSLSEPSVIQSLSYVFVHAGPLHLLLNLLLLGAFGVFLEFHASRRVWLVSSVLGAVAGAYGELLVSLLTGVPREGTLVGASAGLSGCGGAALIIGVRPRSPDLWTRLVRAAAVGWLALQVVAALLAARTDEPAAVAHWAHLWGFVAGSIAAMFLEPMPRSLLREGKEAVKNSRPGEAIALLAQPFSGPYETERLFLLLEAWQSLGDKEQAAQTALCLVRIAPSRKAVEALVSLGASRLLSADERLELAASAEVSEDTRVGLLEPFLGESAETKGRGYALLKLAELLVKSNPEQARAILQRVIQDYPGSELSDLAKGKMVSSGL